MELSQPKRVYISLDLAIAGAVATALIAFSIVFGGVPSASPNAKDRPPIRIAYFPNLTHAPAILAIAKGDFQRELPSYDVEPKVVNAGPDAMEALLAGELDVAYVGPSPAVNTYLKSGGKALQFISGVCSGGASLIARSDCGIRTIADLSGKRVAVPQIGGTQDVSLRHFLSANGLRPQDKGGSVSIIPAKNPDILGLFVQRQVDAAWVPEPWASRLKQEAGGETVVDERDLWPKGAFTTTVLVARSGFLISHPDAVNGVLRVNLSTIAWLNSHPKMAKVELNNELKRLTGKPLSGQVLVEAWNRVQFTPDPNPSNIVAFARAAKSAGYLSGSIDLSKAFKSAMSDSTLTAMSRGPK